MESFNFSKSYRQKFLGEKTILVIIKANFFANKSRSQISINQPLKVFK